MINSSRLTLLLQEATNRRCRFLDQPSLSGLVVEGRQGTPIATKPYSTATAERFNFYLQIITIINVKIRCVHTLSLMLSVGGVLEPTESQMQQSSHVL